MKSFDRNSIETGKRLHTFIQEADNKFESPVVIDGRDSMIYGAFEILNGIKPLTAYKYSYELVHEALTGYYSTIVLTSSNSDNTWLDATVDDIAIGLCSNGGLMTAERVWQVYLYTTMYRVFHGSLWHKAVPLFGNYLPSISFDSNKNRCKISCYWRFVDGIKLETITYKVYPYRVKIINKQLDAVIPK